MAIHQSGEDYLECILMLSEHSEAVRSIDVAESMGYSKPSVSRAMGILRKAGLIEMNGHGHITLTTEGHEKAARVYERHRLLTQWLMAAGVDGEVAARDACLMEHGLSDEAFEKLKIQAEKRLRA